MHSAILLSLRRRSAGALALGIGAFLLAACTRESAGPVAGRAGAGAIPVSAATAKQGSINVTLDGIGTVTPVTSVSVTSRVVGALTEVDYREGQLVKKGDLLAVIDPRPYEAAVVQAEGQLARDQALLKNAELNYARYQDAFKARAIPELQLASAEADVDQYRGTVRLDQGQLDAARVDLDYTRIVSPVDGRVGLRLVDAGNIVQANGTAPIATITQLQPITVIFTISEDRLADVVAQMRLGKPLRVLALDRSETQQLAEGTLLTIDNQVDTSTGTVKARASFPNSHYELFPNQFVNARLLLKTLQDAVIIPSAAVQLNESQSFVYVVGSDGTVKARDVKIAATQGESAAVAGVQVGETVVTEGFDRLQNGSRVLIHKAAPSAAPQPAAAP